MGQDVKACMHGCEAERCWADKKSVFPLSVPCRRVEMTREQDENSVLGFEWLAAFTRSSSPGFSALASSADLAGVWILVSSEVFCFRFSYLGRTATSPRDGTRVVHSPEIVKGKPSLWN